jgi:hypothetical protein
MAMAISPAPLCPKMGIKTKMLLKLFKLYLHIPLQVKCIQGNFEIRPLNPMIPRKSV